MDGAWVAPWVPSVFHYDEESEALLNRYIERFPEFRRPNPMVVEQLAIELRRYTKALLKQPRDVNHRFLRAKVLLKLWYPELAVADSYKALRLIEGSKPYTSASQSPSPRRPLIKSANDHESKVILELKVLLGQALFFANCFTECLDLLSESSSIPEVRTLEKYARHALQQDFASQENDKDLDDIDDLARSELLSLGEIVAVPYPWAGKASRDPEVIDTANRELTALSGSTCVIRRSKTLETQPHAPSPQRANDEYGIFANRSISEKEHLFVDDTVLCGTNSPDRCFGCGSDLNRVTKAFALKRQLFCGVPCATRMSRTSTFASRPSPQDNRPQTEERIAFFSLLSRVLSNAVKYVESGPDRHPLNTPAISRLTAAYRKKIRFSLFTDVVKPIEVLESLGVDVYADEGFESWVLQNLLARIEVNVRQFEISDGYVMAINPMYSFFNHSCTPNVEAVVDAITGSTKLFLTTSREIRQGDELLVSYLDEDQLQLGYEERRKALLPWTGGDCCCSRCEEDRQHHLLAPWMHGQCRIDSCEVHHPGNASTSSSAAQERLPDGKFLKPSTARNESLDQSRRSDSWDQETVSADRTENTAVDLTAATDEDKDQIVSSSRSRSTSMASSQRSRMKRPMNFAMSPRESPKKVKGRRERYVRDEFVVSDNDDDVVVTDEEDRDSLPDIKEESESEGELSRLHNTPKYRGVAEDDFDLEIDMKKW